jgi:ferredoxin
VLAFFVAPLAVALFAGRMFCAGVCPHGALQDLVLWKPVKVPSWLEQGLALLPYVFLGAGVMFAACGSAFIVCRYDPFVPLFRLSGRLSMVLLGAGLLVLGMFIGRPYCRFLCPYGALLRLAASVSKWRARVTPDFCTQCRLCEEACPYGALREPSVGSAEPPTLASDRRRLGWLLLLLPALLLVGGWVGSQISVAASKANATVALAERFADPQETRVAPNPPTPESLSLARAEQDPKTLLAQAISIRKRFATGGWLFGGWLGLVAALKLISLSVRRKRTDYEPDRGACLGCARCFLSCPNERVRLGLLPPEVIGRLGAPGPVAPGKEA